MKSLILKNLFKIISQIIKCKIITIINDLILFLMYTNSVINAKGWDNLIFARIVQNPLVKS